ncbi:MAG: polysaccharide deacetylase family protein [Clostridia bacterium]|nr:polysaccharide deacetylase family protein [Clostridia bacterium]
MKKFLAIILMLAMLFAVTACSVTPENTDTNSDTGTNSDSSAGSTESDTSTKPGTGGTYVPPAILDHDTTNYVAKYADAKQTKIKYGTYSVKAPEIADYYNNYDAALSMTFDDGADIGAARLAESIMSQYGFKGTLFLQISNVQGNISEWQKLVSGDTFDVGSHSWSHSAPSGLSEDAYNHEIKDSLDYLQEKFSYENPVTYATPFSQLTASYKQYLKDCGVISNRLEIGGSMVSPDTVDPDMLTVYAKRIDTGNNQESIVRINVGDALNNGKWFVELYHNVRVQDSTDISEEDFRNHCKWLYDNYNGKVWFASYDDVAKYLVQKQTATIEYTDCDSESMTFVAKVEKNYGQEMTLRLFVPFFIDSAYAIIDGEEQYVEVVKEAGVSNARVIYINTEISEEGTEVKLMLGGNDKYQNNCDHAYSVNEVVEPTVDSFGYTEMICTSCEHTYKELYTNKIGK